MRAALAHWHDMVKFWGAGIVRAAQTFRRAATAQTAAPSIPLEYAQFVEIAIRDAESLGALRVAPSDFGSLAAPPTASVGTERTPLCAVNWHEGHVALFARAGMRGRDVARFSPGPATRACKRFRISRHGLAFQGWFGSSGNPATSQPIALTEPPSAAVLRAWQSSQIG